MRKGDSVTVGVVWRVEMTKRQGIKSHTRHGHYEIRGPVSLPVKIDLDGVDAVKHFEFNGFKFTKNRYGVLTLGDVSGADNPLVRISSDCHWSFIYDSQLCDCKWQLEESKRRIAKEGAGMLIFAYDQNGKGVSLEDHWLIYAEGQRNGKELVVDSYKDLGFKEDYREYTDIADILNHYNLKKIRLMTNSPYRHDAIKNLGFDVDQVNIQKTPVPTYLESEYVAKRDKLGHMLQIN